VPFGPGLRRPARREPSLGGTLHRAGDRKDAQRLFHSVAGAFALAVLEADGDGGSLDGLPLGPERGKQLGGEFVGRLRQVGQFDRLVHRRLDLLAAGLHRDTADLILGPEPTSQKVDLLLAVGDAIRVELFEEGETRGPAVAVTLKLRRVRRPSIASETPDRAT
jgi:hypothetical protein